MRYTFPLVAALVLSGASVLSAQQAVPLRAGMVITTSTRIAPGVYRLSAPQSLDSAVITIRGDDITVDFAGATLQGSDPARAPDERAGVGIRVEGGNNITIRNARVHGFKIGIRARATRNLSLFDNDLSRNWKPRLFSLVEHESLIDWLSHHKNDQDEWLRFGAGVYLADVRGGEIRGNRIEQGMEGLMLTRSDSLRIWNNTIEFNSGVGIGLYRSSHNTIMHNRASFNVRGYSHGFYRRGQDSADLLMYEQSSHNVVAYNSMTHGGDGLFLWAGQSTMDTGQGGSNDNLFYANDFSYAPTNAMEATFSRNVFIGNLARGSEYGLWGGYSFASLVQDNIFENNRTGIAIEHGQDNVIVSNRFTRDSVAINLWANPIEPSDWAYPKHRDTRSRDYLIADNIFTDNRVGMRIAQSMGVHALRNRFVDVDSIIVRRDTSNVLERDPALRPRAPQPPRPLAGGFDVRSGTFAERDRSAMIVDEWGPYDWRSPRLWPVDSSHSTPLALRVLGPAGSWRVAELRGIARVSRTQGRMNDTLVVTPAAQHENDWRITLISNGQRFSYERFQPIGEWTVTFLTYTDSIDWNAPPLMTLRAPRLDYMWYRPAIKELPPARWAARATAQVELPAGTYTLRSISDDGIRVWVDDKLAIDNWQPHGSLVDAVDIAPGKHSLRVEYHQVDGWVELRVEIVRGRQRSTGSPGPH
ncbi:MAG TPA: right-handed parallel beta-helix repeat-containing protein [Longimicrobiales bacterium]|nr:right-handed parallel beta-helix repeat-containing protein [Longimicrobiales bacterium]